MIDLPDGGAVDQTAIFVPRRKLVAGGWAQPHVRDARTPGRDHFRWAVMILG